MTGFEDVPSRDFMKSGRADHVGSLIRPTPLRTARRDRFFGRINDDALEEVENQAIIDVLALQKKAGLGIFSDGEFRRRVWLSALFESLIGMEDSGPDFERFAEMKNADTKANPELASFTPLVAGKLLRNPERRNITAVEIDFLKEHAPGPFKITIPSLAVLTTRSEKMFRAEVTDKYYADREAMLEALAIFIAEDVLTAADAGVPYIQIDNPSYASLMAIERREAMRADDVDPDLILDRFISQDNRLLRLAKGNGAKTALHICLGTYIGAPDTMKNTRVHYDPAAVAKIFESVEADVFLCEFSERSGTMEALRMSPKLGNKVVALGMINVLTPEVESKDAVLRRIEQATKYVPIENLAICNNCGFSGTAADAFVTEAIERQKLGLLVEIAHEVWGTN